MTAEQMKPMPPESGSAKVFVENNWKTIGRMTFDGLPVEGVMKGVDEYLKHRQSSIDAGDFDGRFDWAEDFRIAKFTHEWNKDWLPNQQAFRARKIEYWTDHTKRTIEYNEKISLAASNTMTILHGAVAVGALNIIAQKTPTNLSVITAAKWAIPFSLIGIGLLALGQVIIYAYGNNLAYYIYNNLFNNPSFLRLKAFPRFIRRYGPIIKKGEMLIYGSIVWFFAYCFILFFMIL